jgi:hypothetical protein
VSTGTLKFNVSSASNVGAAAVATIASGATLELAGTVSALGMAGGNRASIVNNSSAPGLVVSGSHQVVGAIDGSGTTQINAGSDLTANHIIQSALVIGGAAGSPGLVTIDASDASGNPLEGFAVPATSLASESPLTDGSNLGKSMADGFNGVSATSPLAPFNSSSAIGTASVPEPSSMTLIAIGCLAVGLVAVRRRGGRDANNER